MIDINNKKKKLMFISTIVIMPILLALLCGELYIRFFSEYGYVTPEIYKRRSLTYESSIFARHVFPQKEQNVIGKDNTQWYINEKGYRGHNFETLKPDGTTRIIIYGGSAVFDIQEKDWPNRVENILRQSGLPNVEVVNAGIPGHASFDSFGRLFAEGHHFKPDYVILYNAWNDIKYFQSEKYLLRLFKPYIEFNDPRLNYRGFFDRLLCNLSQLYVRLRHRYFSWKYNIGQEGRKPSKKYSSKISPLALKQYKLNVEMFVDCARNINAIPILMTQARLVTQHNTETQKERIKYDYQLLDHQTLCSAFEETDKIIAAVAREKKVYLINASRDITGKDQMFVDHVHLTEQGSKELAKITAHNLARLLKNKQ